MFNKTIVLIFAAFLLVGCQKSDTLVGEWTTTKTLQGVSGTETDKFGAGGSYSSDVSLLNESGRGLAVHDRGTWKLESAGVLRVILSSAKWEAVGTTPERKAELEAKFQAKEQSIVESANASGPSKISWNGDDEFTETTAKGKQHVYKRLK